MWRRHIDHLRSGSDQPSDEDINPEFPVASGGNVIPQPQDATLATPPSEETQPADVPHSDDMSNSRNIQNGSDTNRFLNSSNVSSAPRYPSRV